MAKRVLQSSPVLAYAQPGKGYRLYTDASDYGVAAILQQVQMIKVKDLKGTKLYERLERAHSKGRPQLDNGLRRSTRRSWTSSES